MNARSKFFVVLALGWTLTGCGSSGGDDDSNAVPEWCLTQYSTEVTQTFDSGLVLEPATQMYVAPEEVNWFWKELLACVEQTYPEVAGTFPPSVRYESFSEAGSLAAMGGYTQYGGIATALINTDDPIGRRSCSSDEYTLKHEELHHIIWTSGLPLLPFPDGHPSAGTINVHGSALFGTPSQGGCVPAFLDASL